MWARGGFTTWDHVDQSIRGPTQAGIRGEQLGTERLSNGDVAGVVGRATVSQLPPSTPQRDVPVADHGELTKLIDGASTCLDREPAQRVQRGTTAMTSGS